MSSLEVIPRPSALRWIQERSGGSHLDWKTPVTLYKMDQILGGLRVLVINNTVMDSERLKGRGCNIVWRSFYLNLSHFKNWGICTWQIFFCWPDPIKISFVKQWLVRYVETWVVRVRKFPLRYRSNNGRLSEKHVSICVSNCVKKIETLSS